MDKLPVWIHGHSGHVRKEVQHWECRHAAPSYGTCVQHDPSPRWEEHPGYGQHTQWTHIRTQTELQAAHHKGTGHTKSHVLFQSQEGICVGLTSSEPGQLLAHTELLRVTAHTRPHTGQPRVDPGKTQPTGRAVTPHPTSTLPFAAPMLASVKAILRSFLFYALHVTSHTGFRQTS